MHYEYSVWRLSKGGVVLDILAIYKAPYSVKNRLTVNQFTTEFLTLLENVVTDCKNLIVCGDFNIHIDDCEDVDDQQFLETMGSWVLIKR